MTVQSSAFELEHLSAPPIVEVACGMKFKPLPGFDPVVLGAYWQQRRDEFPGREIHEYLTDANEIVWSVAPPVRAWLVSPDKATLLQFQQDRFYFNWRRVDGGTYPRFNDRDGRKGVLSKMLGEFDQFGSFCQQMFGIRPEPIRCELSKIDHLVEETHWHGMDDLALLLPWIKTFTAFAKSDTPNLSVQFSEAREGGDLHVTLAIAPRHPSQKRLVRLETRVFQSVAPDADLRGAFGPLNTACNAVFGELIPSDERKRFKGVV